MTKTNEYKNNHNKIIFSQITSAKGQLLKNREKRDRKMIAFISLSLLYLFSITFISFF